MGLETTTIKISTFGGMIKVQYSIKGEDGTYSTQVFSKRKDMDGKEETENFGKDFNGEMYTIGRPNGREKVENDNSCSFKTRIGIYGYHFR